MTWRGGFPHLVLALAVALLATAPYLVAGVSRDFITLDDSSHIYDNPQVLRGLDLQTALWALRTTENANWYPLTRLTHLVDASLFGMRAGGHHLVSIAWHAAAAVLLFRALCLMTGTLWRSAVVAAIFAVHPLQVESVAWSTERSNVLAGFFFGLTLLLWARHSRRPGTGRRGAVAVALALGLASKPVLVTLPLLLLLLDFWPLGRMHAPGAPPWMLDRVRLRLRLLEKGPLLTLSVLASALALMAQQQAGALQRLEAGPLGLRLGNAALSYLAYLRNVFWPAHLAVYYPHPGPHLAPAAALVAGLFLATLTAAAVAQLKRRPWMVVCWLWYLGLLVPMIGIVQVGEQAMADRYAYLPSIGIFLLLLWFATEELPVTLGRPAILAPAAGVALAALVAASTRQAHLWKDSETLFRHTLSVTTGNHLIRNNYAVVLTGQGRHEEAIVHAREALRLKPGFVDAHINLGNSLLMLGEFEAAVGSYREALRLQRGHGDPRVLAQLHYNLGIPLAALGRIEEAVASYREALRLDPGLAHAHVNLGSSLARLGRPGEAAAAFREALRIQPDFPEAWYNLGLALAQLDRREEAVCSYREALRLRPAYPDARAALAREEDRTP